MTFGKGFGAGFHAPTHPYKNGSLVTLRGRAEKGTVVASEEMKGAHGQARYTYCVKLTTGERVMVSMAMVTPA
jgi:hypothetical protein